MPWRSSWTGPSTWWPWAWPGRRRSAFWSSCPSPFPSWAMPVSSSIVGRVVREKNCTPPPSRRRCIWIRRKVGNKSVAQWKENGRVLHRTGVKIVGNCMDCNQTLEETNMANVTMPTWKIPIFNRCCSTLDMGLWRSNMRRNKLGLRVVGNWKHWGEGRGGDCISATHDGKDDTRAVPK